MHTYTCFKFRRPRINAKRALPDNTSGSGLLSTMLLAKERKPSLPPWDGSWRGDFVNAAVLCLVAQLYLTLCNSMDYSSPGPSVHGILQQEYWSGLPGSPPGDLPKPGIKPRSPALQADSLPAKPPGKPKNTVVGSLSVLQGIFPNQELNRSSALQVDSLPAEVLGKLHGCLFWVHFWNFD